MFKLEPQKAPETSICKVCGRTLTDPESIRDGIGPVCRGASSRKCQEIGQMTIQWEKQRPKMVICMNTGNGWTGFDGNGEQVAYGEALCDLALDILATFGAPREREMGKAFADIIKGATRGVVRAKVIEEFIRDWREKNERI